MAIKNISTRMKICGRGAKCSGGHSAVEQSGYICREKMYSEYDGQTYYPKYAEDLVHSEVLLPDNAPPEYKDPARLWNSVGMAEKGKSAQLARTWRMERAGIHTIRGDINRGIIERNTIILNAKAMLEQAKKKLEEIKAIPVKAVETVKAIKNEILDMIREVAKRNNNHLSLPIRKGEYISKITNRGELQKKEFMETFVHNMGWTAFEEMKEARQSMKAEYDTLSETMTAKAERINYLSGLLDAHKDYSPYQEINAEYWKLKKAEESNKGKGGFLGFAKKSVAQEYKLQHQSELNTYKFHRDILRGMIKEDDKKIPPKAWQKELDTLTKEYDEAKKPYSQLVWKLASIEVLNHNRRDLERMLENESHQRSREPRNRNQSL